MSGLIGYYSGNVGVIPSQIYLLSVQCNVQHWTEYEITLASVRCPSITAKIVSSVLDTPSPNLEHSNPFISQRKYFVSNP